MLQAVLHIFDKNNRMEFFFAIHCHQLALYSQNYCGKSGRKMAEWMKNKSSIKIVLHLSKQIVLW
jgi:hypothetical protein